MVLSTKEIFLQKPAFIIFFIYDIQHTTLTYH